MRLRLGFCILPTSVSDPEFDRLLDPGPGEVKAAENEEKTMPKDRYVPVGNSAKKS
jgi:hypothetical protein